MVSLSVTYDEVANAAYIYLQPPGTRAARMYPCDPGGVDAIAVSEVEHGQYTNTPRKSMQFYA
jgi:uncharacterized protein YuzE